MNQINKILAYIPTEDITDSNQLIKAAASLVCEHFASKTSKSSEVKEPMWKRRLADQISNLRATISKLERRYNSEPTNIKGITQLENKYKVKEKGYSVVIEELKQRTVAIAGKVKRYDNIR